MGERSPFFPEILLSVTDWAFYLWKDGVSEHIFQSSYMTNASTYFTCGRWSPTRPSVVFLGLISGGIDIWDFSDQSHKASLNDVGASVGISPMVFLKNGDFKKEQFLAVGDSNGHLHVHAIPKNLVKEQNREQDLMQKFLDREIKRVTYFQDRRLKLADLKEQMEKQAQQAAEKEEVDQSKVAEAEERADQQSEAVYRKLELECKDELKLA